MKLKIYSAVFFKITVLLYCMFIGSFCFAKHINVSMGDDFDYFGLDDDAYTLDCFYKIEAIAKELCCDLEDLYSDDQIITACLEESSYLSDQFAKLTKSTKELLENSKESIFYLPEDIQYLLAVIDCVESKYLHVVRSIKGCKNHPPTDMNRQLVRARSNLEELLMSNEEVSLC